MAGSTSLRPEGLELNAENVALSAVFGAAVFVGTVAIAIPVGIGFLNFGEIIIYTAAFLFGSVVGGIAGGVGAALADIALGFAFFAPVTFVVKGIEGAVVGYLSGASTRSKIVAVVAGAPFMIVGYFVAVAYFEGIPSAVARELPIDIIQAVVGLVIALPVAEGLRSRLPRISAEREIPADGAEEQFIAAFLWMGGLSILLFWLPVLGGLIAGIVGGIKAGNVLNAILAAILPGFIAGGALYFVLTTFGLPVIGALVAGFTIAVVLLSSIALIGGAIVGGVAST